MPPATRITSPSDDAVANLSQALQEAVTAAGAKAEMEKLGIVPFDRSQAVPAALKKHLQAQIDLWTPIIQ